MAGKRQIQREGAEQSMRTPDGEMHGALTMLERSANAGLWMYEVASDVLHWSDGVFAIFGDSRGSYTPTLSRLIENCAPLSRQVMIRAGLKALKRGSPFALNLEIVQANGRRRRVRVIGEPKQAEGKVYRIVGCALDVQSSVDTEEHNRLLEEQLRYYRDYDSLTDLPNRKRLENELTECLVAARRRGAGGWLLYLDLDRFKLINEACGPAGGDRLIRETATLLRENIESADFLARLGSDQFAIIIAEVEPAAAMRKATALVDLIDQYRFHGGANAFHVSVSIGAAPIDVSVRHSGELFRRAEASCHVAKQQGGSRVVVFRHADTELANSETDLSWGEEILLGLDKGRFVLYAQRLVDIAGGSAPSYEVLLRLHTSDGSMALPGRFLPAARRYGLMNAIDRHVVQLLLRYLADSNDLQANWGHVSVNLSGASLCDDSFIGFLLPALTRSGIEPNKICFEITESEALHDIASAQEMVARLHASGYRVFLDDFGNGFTSFHYLKNLQVVGLKLDNSYIRHLDREPFNQAVVSSVSRICGHLGLELVAEGVENVSELDVLKRFGVHRAQGFLFHRPEPLANAILSDYPSEPAG